MYGATEATARMAYLPPHLAEDRPDAIGVAIPGGHAAPRRGRRRETGVGELVYSGPNVMLGYAEAPADLALGRVVDELRTGDLARQARRALRGRRPAQPLRQGLRPAARPRRASSAASRPRSTGAPVSSPPTAPSTSSSRAVAAARPPARSRRATAAYPPMPCASPSCRRCRSTAAASSTTPRCARHAGRAGRGHDDGRRRARSARRLRARARPPRRPRRRLVRRRSAATRCPTSSSPPGSPTPARRPAGRLAHPRIASSSASARAPSPRPAGAAATLGAGLDTTVGLRALAIFFVVASHVDLVALEGGAHLLLALAGFNFARFQLSARRRRPRPGCGTGSPAWPSSWSRRCSGSAPSRSCSAATT